jgi:hypothetical protein
MKQEAETKIGGIGNYYGGLYVKKSPDGRFFWSIENYNGNDWEEIPASLYVELVRFNESEGHKNHETHH